MNVPVAAFLFQSLVALDGALAAGTSHRQLHGQHRKTHDHEKQQIQGHKPAAAVLPHDIGEFPHIADAYGTARADQQKAEAGPKGFSFHFHTPIFKVFLFYTPKIGLTMGDMG